MTTILGNGMQTGVGDTDTLTAYLSDLGAPTDGTACTGATLKMGTPDQVAQGSWPISKAMTIATANPLKVTYAFGPSDLVASVYLIKIITTWPSSKVYTYPSDDNYPTVSVHA